LQVEGLICEANTLGSCGYVYIAIYPMASRSSGQ
ncbi:type IV toxin-antitoxin system YeeU family antitoxin, partial [Escherichia coli]|nr:type IV toxin-antitoxin system YeeU family antitoxin [Escherichia coli]